MHEPLLAMLALVCATLAIAAAVLLPRWLTALRGARAELRGAQAALPATERLIDSIGARVRRVHQRQRALEAGILAAGAVAGPFVSRARAARLGLSAALRSFARRNGRSPGSTTG